MTFFDSRTMTDRYHDCAVCGAAVRAHSRYCEKHSRRAYRTGDPRGRVFKDWELRPYRKLYDEYLDRHADHPGVIAAHETMYNLLHSPHAASFMRTHMDRLRNEGATPREMLVAALAVFGYDRDSEVLLASDNCVTAAAFISPLNSKSSGASPALQSDAA